MNNFELEQRIASKQQENGLFVRVAEMYKAGMIRSGIARQNKIGEDVVKRILISLNLMKTKYSVRIIPLMRSDMSKKRIAKYLKISINCVNANSPYTRGTYLIPSTTKNAETIRRCRNNKKNEGQNIESCNQN